MKIYTIHDDAAEYFFSPFVARTDAEAQRMFVQSMGDKFRHRADFQLCILGDFDQDTGIITSDVPKVILAGLSIPAAADPLAPPLDNEQPNSEGHIL